MELNPANAEDFAAAPIIDYVEAAAFFMPAPAEAVPRHAAVIEARRLQLLQPHAGDAVAYQAFENLMVPAEPGDDVRPVSARIADMPVVICVLAAQAAELPSFPSVQLASAFQAAVFLSGAMFQLIVHSSGVFPKYWASLRDFQEKLKNILQFLTFLS